jgi:hypothetical protein
VQGPATLSFVLRQAQHDTAEARFSGRNGIISRVPDPKALLERHARAIAVARRKGVHAGHVRTAFNDEDLRALPDRNKSANSK